MISVLVAEDSPTTREQLVHLLSRDPELAVVGEVADGEAAVEAACGLRPDVILMDIEMPRVDGYEATRRIMHQVPTPIVMVTGHDGDLESRAFEALAAGALVLVGKPPGLNGDTGAERLIATIKLMAEVKVVRRWRGRPDAPPPPPPPITPTRRARIVAVGASAGGPPTVAEILGALPARCASPILLVQHISDGFAAGLAEWLDRSTALRVKLGQHQERARPGVVYVAPDNRQMGITNRGVLELTADEGSEGFRPSASHLLSSVARSYGPAAVGVLLTGMGRDGAAGLLEVRRRGGVTIAQDKASSVVFGMPGEAIRLGAAEHVLPPARIAAAIRTLIDDRITTDRRRLR